MTTLDDVIAIAGRDQYLATVSTVRGDGTVQASLVNAGVMQHPVNGDRVVAFVTYGPTKLANLRSRPAIAVTWRSGWEWATVEGSAELIGIDDAHPAVDAEQLRVLLRDVFVAAGGTHDDWDGYDRTMREQRRVAVLVPARRVYSNRGS